MSSPSLICTISHFKYNLTCSKEYVFPTNTKDSFQKNHIATWWLKCITSVRPSKLYLLDVIVTLPSCFDSFSVPCCTPEEGCQHCEMAGGIRTACQGSTFCRHKNQGDSSNGAVMGSGRKLIGMGYRPIYAKTSRNTKLIGRTVNYLNNLGPASERKFCIWKIFRRREAAAYMMPSMHISKLRAVSIQDLDIDKIYKQFKSFTLPFA